MKSIIIQPSHVRGLGNILDNEDNIQGLHCRVEAQDALVEFDDLELKTYYMGTGTQLNIRFILDTISILPEQTVHVDVLVTDDENNPVSGVDLYVYESNELISQMETDDDGYGVEDGSLGFNFTSEDVGKHTLKCVIPRQDLYYESKNELVINVLQETTLTLTIDPDSIDTLTDTITLYGTLLNEDDEPVVGEIITFYDNTTLLGWSITNDDGVATLVVNIEDIQDLGLVPTIDIDWIMTSDNPNNHTEDGSLYVSATISDTGISGLPLTILVNNTVMFEGVTDSTGHADLLSTTLSENAVVTVITQHTNLYNATTKQYRLGETEKLPTTTSLAVSSNTIYVDGSTTATATVTSGGSGVNGLTVTFKDGSTTLGTGTTNSSGVATYTVSGLSAGNHSITAVVTENSTYAASTSSAVSLTVNNHSYSLAFSAASYVATGGSATLSVTLLDNNVAVSGATVSVAGSDSSLYSGITNSNGVAEVTVTNVSAETTFTATYSNATATCIVTVQALTLSLSANKNVLSCFDSETATLTAVYSGGSGATIELYNAATSVKIGNFTDAGNGNYTYSYSSAGTGDISLMAKIGTLESSSVSIEDCIFYGINTNAFTIPSNTTFTSDGSKITATTSTSGEKIVSSKHAFNQNDNFVYEVEVADIGSVQSVAVVWDNTAHWGGQSNNDNKAFANLTGSDSQVSHTFAVGDKYKVIRDNGTTSVYINDTLIKSASVSYNSTFTVGFYINRGRTQYYKNIKIKPI